MRNLATIVIGTFAYGLALGWWRSPEMAARKENATAIYNVGVLFENRGEMDKAKIAYETAKKLQDE